NNCIPPVLATDIRATHRGVVVVALSFRPVVPPPRRTILHSPAPVRKSRFALRGRRDNARWHCAVVRAAREADATADDALRPAISRRLPSLCRLGFATACQSPRGANANFPWDCRSLVSAIAW